MAILKDEERQRGLIVDASIDWTSPPKRPITCHIVSILIFYEYMKDNCTYRILQYQ
jgi:hypothetical protein